MQMLTDEDEWAATFADSSAGKTVATLAKRVASLWKFITWTEANGPGPAINAGESEVYRYRLEPKETGTPTTATSFSISERLLLGHHLTRESRSAVVYGRDELTRIAVVVYQTVRNSKNKKFRPDASRAERVALQVGLLASDGEQESPSPVMMMMRCQKMSKQLKAWIVTEQVGKTSSLMSCKDFEFMFFRGCSQQVVPR